MTLKFGEDWRAWPKIGCGAKFVPYKKGKSRAIELKLDDGTWEAFLADRLPKNLDDEIKRVHADFYKAAEKCTAAELIETIPVTFPMTHLFKEFPGIAKYPVDQWEREGELVLDQAGWCKICLKIAEKDMTNLGMIFETAQKISQAAL